MASPFKGFENSTITFKVSDGTYITNSVGNRRLDTVDLIIKAVLKPAYYTIVQSYTKEIQQFAGVDSHAVLLEGYLVDPQTYPSEVQFLAEADATIKTAKGKEETGRFKLLPIVQSPYVIGVKIDIITPIRGIFRRS